MARQDTRTFMRMLIDDPGLRRRFISDPRGTISGSGLSIDPDDAAALQSIDWSGSDEQLRARANRDCAQMDGDLSNACKGSPAHSCKG